MKPFNRLVDFQQDTRLRGKKTVINGVTIYVLERDRQSQNGYITRAYTEESPVNLTGQAGFARGALLIYNSGTNIFPYATPVFVNVGSETSSSFGAVNALGSANPNQVTMDRNVVVEEFKEGVTCVSALSTAPYGDPTGAAGDVNLIITPYNIFKYFIIGTQTILAPTWGANGLDIGSLDQTNAEGAEWFSPGAGRTDLAFTVGDNAMFLEMQCAVTDVSGLTEFFIGFRKQAAHAAAMSSYTDYAGIDVVRDTTNPAIVNRRTRLNNGSEVVTDTTAEWADTETHTVRVDISKAGVLSATFDGDPLTLGAAFTADAGDIYIPSVRLIQHTDATGACPVSLLRVGRTALLGTGNPDA